MRALRAIAAALLAGCASTVSTSDASVDAAAGVDVAAADAPAVGAMVCYAGRTCTAAPPEVTAAACYAPGGVVELTAPSVSLSFCRCLHGFGPGVEGTLGFTLTNQTARAVQVDLRPTLTLTSVADGRPVDLGACCTLHIARSYTCQGEPTPWRGRVEPARTERIRVDVHLDAPETPPGRFRVGLTIAVDGAPRAIDMGEAELPLAPTP